MSPDKQLELIHEASAGMARFLSYCWHDGPGHEIPLCIEPLPQDTRFTGEEWRQWPFNVLSQAFLLTQDWWRKAATGVAGVSKHHEDIVVFLVRQVLDTISPKNFPLTNPEVITQTLKQGGINFVRGALNFWEDWQRLARGIKPVGTEAFEVGRDVAITPGKVVFRNRLIELIQYETATPEVWAEPVLIIPAWIMKYYILDLSPQNSLVRYLVAQGYTVFMISWKNPDTEDGDLGMEDYRELGAMAAINAVSAIVPCSGIHAAGYCLGSKGVIGVATCDKGLPAMMLALASMHDLPCVLVPGGVTLLPDDGEDAGRVQSVGARFAHRQMTLEQAAENLCRACATPGGGCQFLGTAATSQVVGEALGLSLTHSALAPSGHPIWLDMARRSARAVLRMEERRLAMRDI